MLYYFVKFFSKLGFRAFFRKIYFHNEPKISRGKSVLFAVNHPTAFIEPVLIPSLMVPVVYFIVRGDIFVGKFVLTVLKSLKMYPIFRFRDGFSSLKNNQSIMEMMYRFLRDGKNIFILAEGETKHEKRLRPIQKGGARMAFGAVEKYGKLDILVVPVGINYTDSDRFRSHVMVKFGEPVPLSNYWEAYEENPRKAVNQLTRDLQKWMQQLVIHVKEEADDNLANEWLDLHRNSFKEPVFPLLSREDSLRQREFALVEQLNAMPAEEKAGLQEIIKGYQTILQMHEVEDVGVAKAHQANFGNTLLLMLGAIPFCLLYLINCPPLLWANRIADQKVKKVEFHASVRYGAGLVFYLAYWIILLIVALIVGNWWIVLFVFLLPFLGLGALLYRDLYFEWRAAKRFQYLSESVKKDILEVRKTIPEISK